jgi:hypothetical protein
MRYVAYMAFAMVAMSTWAGLTVWLFLRDYGCAEGGVASVCTSVPSRIGHVLLWLSLPLTALLFSYFRKLIRRALQARDHTWRDQ